jgi:hypothetical protein
MCASKSAKAYLISDPHLSIDDAARGACGSLSDALPDIPAVGGLREVVGTGRCGAGIFCTWRPRLAREVAPGMQRVRSWPSLHIVNECD